MELIDFFSFNTVYLEMQELFDEYSIEKTAKSSINKSRKELLECYEDESDMITQVYMSSYFMSLQNGFCDEKSKNILEAFSEQEILLQFGEEDFSLIYEMIQLLLKEKPQKKTKIESSNPGAYSWKSSDVFAYQLTDADTKDESLQGKYILIYCIENNIKSKKKSDVRAYLLLKKDQGLSDNIEDNIRNSEFLPNRKEGEFILYRNWFADSNRLYPKPEKFIYLGNMPFAICPQNEFIPQPIFNHIVAWEWFGENIENMVSLKNRICNGGESAH